MGAMGTMTPRPKMASGPLVAQPALPLAGSVSASHRATTTTTTIKAGEFMVSLPEPRIPRIYLEYFPSICLPTYLQSIPSFQFVC